MITHDRDKVIAAAKKVDPSINEETVDFLDDDGMQKLEAFYTIAFEAGRIAEREACAKNVGDFARKWWSIHSATNRHLETTRAAHDDFCALQIAIRARGDMK